MEDKKIVFEGELSEECKRFYRKTTRNILLFSWLSITAIFVAVITVAAIFWSLLALIFLALPLFLAVMLIGPYTNPDLVKKVVIENDYVEITINSTPVGGIKNGKPIPQTTYLRGVEDIKEIIDYGNFYDLKIPRLRGLTICQKDLIKEGSLQDFEELFADKITRKNSL